MHGKREDMAKLLRLVGEVARRAGGDSMHKSDFFPFSGAVEILWGFIVKEKWFANCTNGI